MLNILLILILLIFNYINNAISASTPIKIGLLLNTFDSNQQSIIGGQQLLQSFLMGLEEVTNFANQKGDDYHFEFIFFNAFGHYDSARKTLDLIGKGVHSVISALPNKEAVSTLLMIEDEKILTIVAAAQAEEMSNYHSFPYKLRLPASESYDGIILKKLVHSHFEYEKVTIFFTTDQNSIGNSLNFLKGRKGRKFKILSEHEIDEYAEDYSDYIIDAKESGAKVFAFFMHANTCAKLLIQGYELGLFKEDQIIFTIEQCSGEELISEFHNNFAKYVPEMPKLLKGIVGLKYDPKYTLLHSTKGKEFMQKFKSRPSTNVCTNTIITRNAGSLTSNLVQNAVDDNLAVPKYLYRYDNSAPTCTGLDYSQYDASSSQFEAFTPFLYDSVKLLEKIYRKLIVDDNLSLTDIDVYNMMEAAFNLPEYEGVTGPIKLFDGNEAANVKRNGLYGYGDREIGQMFSITNFNTKENKFVNIGRIDDEDNYQLCDERVKETLHGDELNCDYMIEYNSKNNQKPSDTKPDILMLTSDTMIVFLQAIGAIGVVYVLGISIVLFYRRNSKLMKASQPPMVAIVLLGEILAFIRVFFGGEHPTPEICIKHFWYGHLAFVMVFGGLSFKTWRVYKIISNTSLKRVRISAFDVLRRTLILISFTVVYIIIVQTVAVSTIKETHITISNQSTYHIDCHFKYHQLETALYVLEALLLVYGANLCNAAKDAPR